MASARTSSGWPRPVWSRAARVRHGRGRPRDEWTVAPAAHPGGDPPHAYADLGRWLARAIPASPAELRAVEQTGREIGRDMHSPSAGEDPAAAFADALSAMGFEPELAPSEAGICATLGNCPYREAVKANPALVCTLHRGIAQGVLDAVAPGALVTRFVMRDPDEAGCIVEASGLELGTA